MTTLDDMRRDALDTITGQCRRMFESVKESNTEQLRAENESLQKTLRILGIIEE